MPFKAQPGITKEIPAMPSAFASIAFTPSVKAAQTRYGSRENNRGFELSEDPRNELGEYEIAFIEARDSFYQATVSENSWPYVQHRGGSAGFLRVLDSRTIGFADLSGNRQYLSVGNLNASPRISLILMDYPNRRRLKLWGTVRIIHETDEPELIARLEVASYRARVERGIVIHIEAIEWNCPQHITPRYTEAEMAAIFMSQVESRGSGAQPYSALGNGPQSLVISGIRQLTPRVRAYELRHHEGGDLPEAAAGSHLNVPVLLEDGTISTRNYSISSNPARRDIYEIAVLLEPEGHGGSRFIHSNYQLGMTLHCSQPRNDFALHEDSRPAVLIAGGIGITPIKAMALALAAKQQEFQLHYAGRGTTDMAYLDRLQREFGERLHVYTPERPRLDLAALMATSPVNTVFYACGPQRLMDDVSATAQRLGIAAERIRMERFAAPSADDTQSIEVELFRSGKTLTVSPQQSILDAVEAAGISANYGCRAGGCGLCAIKVLEGEPRHLDAVLSEHDRTQDHLMCICVSRANSKKLVLDL